MDSEVHDLIDELALRQRTTKTRWLEELVKKFGRRLRVKKREL